MTVPMRIEPATPGTALARLQAPDILGVLFAGKNPNTLRAYAGALRRFAVWWGVPPGELAARLCALGPGDATALVLAYRGALLERGRTPATVNGALAALAAVLRVARAIGCITWTVEVPTVKAEAYRDTRGPGVAGYRALLAAADAGADPRKAARDRALLRVLFDMALRRGEAVSLDLADVEREPGTGCPVALLVLGKGKRQRVRVSVPQATGQALAAWLVARGAAPGPLFLALDRGAQGSGRLSGTSVHRLVAALGRRAGLGPVRPHGLRHAAITAALDAELPMRKVQRFSRHAKPDTLLRYDDNRTDLGGEVAEMVSALGGSQ